MHSTAIPLQEWRVDNECFPADRAYPWIVRWVSRRPWTLPLRRVRTVRHFPADRAENEWLFSHSVLPRASQWQDSIVNYLPLNSPVGSSGQWEVVDKSAYDDFSFVEFVSFTLVLFASHIIFHYTPDKRWLVQYGFTIIPIHLCWPILRWLIGVLMTRKRSLASLSSLGLMSGYEIVSNIIWAWKIVREGNVVWVA